MLCVLYAPCSWRHLPSLYSVHCVNLMCSPPPRRAKLFVAHMHSSTKAWAELRQLQREWLAEDGTEATDEDDASPWDLECDGSDGGSSDRCKPKVVLSLKGWVETRWNSLYYLVRR